MEIKQQQDEAIDQLSHSSVSPHTPHTHTRTQVIYMYTCTLLLINFCATHDLLFHCSGECPPGAAEADAGRAVSTSCYSNHWMNYCPPVCSEQVQNVLDTELLPAIQQIEQAIVNTESTISKTGTTLSSL